MSEFTGMIYCLTSPSGKKYIGQTINLASRLAQYKKPHRSIIGQRKIYAAILKYKFETFSIEVLSVHNSQEELNLAEIAAIKKFDTIKNGYNLLTGGANGQPSEETRRRMSISHLGKKPSAETLEKQRLYRLSHPQVVSQEQLKKLFAGRDSNPPGMTGKTHTEETKTKMSEAAINRPKSEAHKVALSKAKQKFIYTLVDPLGEVFTTTNLKEFCETKQLIWGPVYGVINLEKKHKGWKVTRQKQDSQ